MTFVLTNFWPLLLCRFLVGAAHMTISHLPYMLGKYWAKKLGSHNHHILSLLPSITLVKIQFCPDTSG